MIDLTKAVEVALKEFQQPRQHTNQSMDGPRANMQAALKAALPVIGEQIAEALRDELKGFDPASDEDINFYDNLQYAARAVEKETK